MAIEQDEPEAPRKEYGFKEREFKRDNPTSTNLPPMPTAKELAIMSGQKPPSATKTSGGANRAADPNDVYAVLQKNRAAEKQFGLNEVQIKEIKSRRTREYWLTLIGGNIFIVGVVYLIGFNAFTLIYGLAGVVMFSIGLTWVMWQIMAKY